jgi:recombinational DNA repair ATPase RecF
MSSFNEVFDFEDKQLNPVSCEICRYRTSTLGQLRKHMQLFHQDQVPTKSYKYWFENICDLFILHFLFLQI